MLYTTDFSGPVFNGPSWVVRNYLEKKGKTAQKVWKLKKKFGNEKKCLEMKQKSLEMK